MQRCTTSTQVLVLGSTEVAAVGCLDCCRTVQQPLQLMQQQTGIIHFCPCRLSIDKHSVQPVLLRAASFACIVLEICSCSGVADVLSPCMFCGLQQWRC
jgi:hypothetical protein